MNWQSIGLRYAGLGMATGMIGMAALLAQPIFDPPGAPPIRTSDGKGNWSESFHVGKADIIAQTGDRTFAGRRFPAAIAAVPGDAPGSSVLTAQIRNASGTVIGVASRYTVSEAPGARPDRLWTLVLTRRGTIATLCTDARPDSCGEVIGGAGAFAGLRGRMVERQRGAGFDLLLTGRGTAL